MVKLSRRLKTIYDMCPKSIVADVGADHGKLIISLVENGIASYGYAIENKKGPFERLKKAIEEAHLIDKIKVLLSDGLKDIPDTVNTIVIAGMGGDLIVNILKRDILKLKNITTIIADAHSNIKHLREEITKMRYIISAEEIVLDAKKYYEIIKFTKADIAFLSEIDKEFGPFLRKEKSCAFKEKYAERIKKIEALIKNGQLSETRKEALLEEKRRIDSVL
jgi:tRNA (adenine22-N1)-methyltransferase